MDFAFFIVLNAVLLIRPEDFLPDFQGLRLYLIVIVANLLVSSPRIFEVLRPTELGKRPITVCVFGLLASTVISLVDRGRISDGLDFGGEFGKVVLYYLLLVAVINTPSRLRLFLGFLVALISVVTVMALLQFHGYIDIEVMRPIMQGTVDPQTGELVTVPRLRGAGTFNDPNDLCLITTMGTICCLCLALTTKTRLLSFTWLLPIAVFIYAMILTQSRGGVLGFLAAIGAYLIAKYGWRKAMPLVIIGAPAALFAIGGRQADINMSGNDTAMERVMFWAQGFTAVQHSPVWLLTGIGADTFVDEVGHVAHNSYVHSYIELGLFGGTLFLAAFVFAGRMLYSVAPINRPRLSQSVAAMAPFMFALVAGYGAGIYSLSRNYVVPTYLCLGIAATYLTMAIPNPPVQFRISPVWLKQTAILGVAGFVGLKIFTMIAGHLGF